MNTTAYAKPINGNKRSWLVKALRSWRLYVLLAPTFIYLFVFNYIPMYGVQIAFRNFTARDGIMGSQWVGFDHFTFFFDSPQFEILVTNTVLISVYTLMWSFPFPIILALMVNEIRRPRIKKTIQTITYAPFFISVVVLVNMINVFLSQPDGLFNQALQFFGFETVNFLGRSAYFRTIFISSGIWQSIGWNSIIYIAALSSVDMEQHEAAMIDGASKLQRIWHINIPCIIPTAVILFILSTGHIMSVGFERIFLMQNALNLDVSEVISTYVYKVGLLRAQFSLTTAIGLFNSVINLILLLIVNWTAKKTSNISLF